MNNYPYKTNPMMPSKPIEVLCTDPYLVAALRTLIRKRVVVDTVRGSLHGILIDVKPDHILLGERYEDSRFFIRLQQIVSIMPDLD